LIAVYEALDKRENARSEFTELMGVQNKFSHALVFGMHQAHSHLVDLQTDPEIGRALGALLEKSRQFGANLPQVRRVLRRLAQSIQMPMASLKMRSFGRPEVTVSGRAINASDWTSQSARDLLYFFLTQQEPRTREQISLEIWQDAEEPGSSGKRFKQDIYRLRRAVGRHVILFDEEAYRFNRDLDYEYDVEAFESYLFRAHAAKDIVERIGYYRKAVDLVQGPYLSDVDATWATYERERLKIAYASALENLAQLYLDTNQLPDCLNLCKLALSEDPYNEKVYQVEMRALAAQGDRTAVALRFKEYEAILANDLGLTPSEEMELLFRQLTK
jgi:two-component SAPR family response regulator